MTTRLGVAAVAVAAACSACGGSANGNTDSIIGSFYPLAWAAQAIGGPHVSVIDLTTLSELKRIKVGKRPNGIAASYPNSLTPR